MLHMNIVRVEFSDHLVIERVRVRANASSPSRTIITELEVSYSLKLLTDTLGGYRCRRVVGAHRVGAELADLFELQDHRVEQRHDNDPSQHDRHGERLG